MGALFAYSLVASLFVTLLYPVARQVVTHSAAFRFNRIFLFLSLGMCLLLPLIINMSVVGTGGVATGKGLTGMTGGFFAQIDGTAYDGAVQTTAPLWTTIIGLAVMIYVFGVGAMLIRETAAYLRLYSIIRRSERIDKEDYTLCLLTGGRIAPFSWGRYIFLDNDKAEESGFSDEILLHERAHVECGHWIDVLLCDIICTLLWYNPLAWKTRSLVKLNNEFQADSRVVASGVDPYNYQLLLVATAMHRNVPAVANCFGADRQGFRKRVLAIGRGHTSRKGQLVALWAVPAIVAGLFVTSLSLSGRVLEEISMTTVALTDDSPDRDESGREERSRTAVKPMAEFEGGEAALYDFLIQNIVYPEVPEEEMDVRHKVTVLFDVTKEGHLADIRIKNPKGDAYEEEACRVLRLTEGKWKPAVKDGKPVDCDMRLPFYFTTK